MASSKSYTPPCAACKFLRRKCIPSECIFWPYFPPQEHQKFLNVRKIFGASNVAKHLNELLPHQRRDAANSLAYEAEERVRDPVYGCVGIIASLHRQVNRLQKELDAANADLLWFAQQQPPAGFDGNSGTFYETLGVQIPCDVGWNDSYNNPNYDGGMHGSN